MICILFTLAYRPSTHATSESWYLKGLKLSKNFVSWKLIIIRWVQESKIWGVALLCSGRSRGGVPLIYASVNSNCILPPPPPSQLLQGICPHCKSQELGICQPWGISRAFNRHVVSYPNITERGGCYWKHKQMSMGWGGEKLLETLCMHFFIAFQARTYVAKSRAIDMNRCTVCFGYLIKFLLIQDFNKIKWRWF